MKMLVVVLIFLVGIIFDFIFIRKNIVKINGLKPFKIGFRKPKGSIISDILYTSAYYGLIVPPFFELFLGKIYILAILVLLSLIVLFYIVETIRFAIYRILR